MPKALKKRSVLRVPTVATVATVPTVPILKEWQVLMMHPLTH